MTFTTQVPRTREGISVTPSSYRGWDRAYVISNKIVEALVVPQIGRIMQFRFCGDATGPFWENPALECAGLRADEEGWQNYGGDKCWPAPQSDWQRVTGNAWPPPLTFDSAPMAVTSTEGSIRMESSVDPQYGIRITRTIRISPHDAEMLVDTEFTKVFGTPVSVGIWIVSQLKGHGQVFAPLPKQHTGSAFRQITGPTPQEVEIADQFVSLRRHATENVKIALECNSLLWMDEHCTLRIIGQSLQNVSSAAYTNKDPFQYVELETESSISKLSIGQQISHQSTYTLFRRRSNNASEEATGILKLREQGGPDAS